MLNERKREMYGYWPQMFDAVHCGSCNEVHAEPEVVKCNHCEKSVCPSCGDVSEGDERYQYWGYHKPCAAYVDGESDVDPAEQTA